MEILKLRKKPLNKAVLHLKRGGILICATDTVYGFLGDAQDKKGINRIYKIKKRPKNKPLPVFVKDIKMAKELAEISPDREKTIKKYWPGKYTFVLKIKRKNQISKSLIKNGAIAIRVPNNKFLLDLLKKVNRPLAQTSVNISGQPPLRKPEEIIRQFQSQKDLLFIDAGTLPNRKPSAIIDLTSNKAKNLR